MFRTAVSQGYQTSDGRVRSLYRNRYRVQFTCYLGGRMRDIDKLITADDEYQARAQIMRGYDVRNARGRYIELEHVEQLQPIAG